MKMSLFGTRIFPLIQAETLRLPPVHLLRLMALAGVVALASGLRFANLETLGYANHYYTAAVESMLQSWHNFFFVAAEPGGAVSVDKPPLGLWLQAISAYFLGVNGFAVLLPEIIAGILSVVVVYHLVCRSFGPMAGLLASLALAITPVVVATDRNNTMDSPLILTLLLAAWAFIKATESSRRRYLLLGAVLVGLGFNIKMLQAYLPLPAFYALYFFGATERLRRKIVNLALATVLLLIVSLSWAVIVDLTPADQRPYVGSSGNNSALNLALGYNGLARLTGPGFGGGMRPPQSASGFPSSPGSSSPPSNQNGPLPPSGSGTGSPPRPGLPGPGRPGSGSGVGQPGLLRLFTAPLSKEISWLLPFGLVSAVLLGVRTRLRWPFAPRHQALVLWGGWLLIGVVFFSIARFFHEYYLSMLGAPLAALVGIGAVELWHMRTQRPWLATGLLLTTSGTLGLQLVTAITFAGKVWWLLPAIILFVAGVGLLMVSATRQLRRGAMVGFACVIVALLLTPGIWSGLTTFNTGGNSSPLPSAYSGKRSSPPSRPGSSAKPPSGFVNRNGLRLNQALLDYLEPRTQNTTYLMAVPSSMQGADYVIATGRPVLYLGGFGGMDPVVTVDEMVWLVTNGKLRYVYWDRGSAPGNPRPGSSNIFTWVAAHCTPVKDFETIPSNFGTSNGIPTTGPTDAVSAYPRFPGMQLSLYNCGS